MGAKARHTVPPPPHGIAFREMHCVGETCTGKFLGYEAIKLGAIQIKCHKCKATNRVSNVAESLELPEQMEKAVCASCGRFLYDQVIFEGVVRVKCRGCGEWNTLDVAPVDNSKKRELNKVG